MRKFSLLAALGLVVIFSCAFSLGEWRDSLYDRIRVETVKALKDTLKKDVSIGSVEGKIVGQVVFKDVAIPGFARVKNITVNYDLLKLAYRRDIVAAISKIYIVSGDFDVIRGKSGDLNVLSLLPASEPGGPPPPPFLAKLIFKNCAVNYRDARGFGAKPASFKERMENIAGSIDFSKKNTLLLDISGAIQSAKASVNGSVDLVTQKYSVNISVSQVDFRDWGNYVLSLPALKFESGKVDVSLNIYSPPKPGDPALVSGDFALSEASASYNEYKLEKGSGHLRLGSDSVIIDNLNAQVNGLSIAARGSLRDFVKQKIDFYVSIPRGNLKNLVEIFPDTRAIKLSGIGDASFRIRGTALDPKAAGEITISKGSLFGQPFSGLVNLAYEKQKLKLDIAHLEAYKGKISGPCAIDFSNKIPHLAADVKLKGISLASLSQNTPGVYGNANGELTLSGPLDNLAGRFKASLSRALFFGQPMDKLSASFNINKGEVLLEDLSALSKNSSVHSSGKISRDLEFTFQTSAQGIKLASQGVIGSMEAKVDFFQGNVSWKLDEKFLASPLKNLKALGKVHLSNGRLGEQQFDLARGEIDIGDGLIRVKDVTIQHNNTSLEVSGQTGIGHPTSLKFKGTQADLDDLKILNLILPEEARDPTGTIDLDLEITGELSRETILTSIDPLLGLNAHGELTLLEVKIADAVINRGQIVLDRENGDLNISKCSLETPGSNFSLSFTSRGENISGNLTGIILFDEFSSITSKYGNLGGSFAANLVLAGTTTQPNVSATFRLSDFYFNQLDFGLIEGSVYYAQNNLVFTKPVKFISGINAYEISGFANLRGLESKKPEETYLDLNLKVLKGDLSSAIDLVDKAGSEFARKYYVESAKGKTRIDISSLLLPSPAEFFRQGKVLLYAKNGEKDYFLKKWGAASAISAKQKIDLGRPSFGGKISGNIALKGRVDQLFGKFDGRIADGYFNKFNFDNFQAEGTLLNNNVSIKKIELSKGQGEMKAQGLLALDGKLSLLVTAKNMPIDILKSAFDRDFQGTFNLRASVEGSVATPEVSADIAGSNWKIAGVEFDKASIIFVKKGNLITIFDSSLVNDNAASTFSGSIYLLPPGNIKIRADIRDNGVGIFNLFTADAAWLKGKANGSFILSGPLSRPVINGSLEVNNGAVYVKAIDSAVANISGSAEVKDNRVKIDGLSGVWQGDRTRGYRNFLGIAGTIDLNQAFSNERMITLDLTATPYRLFADLPNLFAGEIDLQQLRLFGSLYFDLSKGPAISGRARISNAVLTLSKKQEGKKSLPINFDLTVALDKNVYAVMGDVSTFDLSNILMNLEAKCDELKISGNSLYPSLLGNLEVKRGSLNIFNREFTLLSAEQQRSYFPYDTDKVQENSAVFKGEAGVEGSQPQINITAKVDVENQEQDAAGNITKKKVVILSRLQGVLGAKEKERGLNVTFFSFLEDADNNLKPASYSEQDIKVMLLPDFIKSLTGVGKPEKVDTNAVVADYLTSRVQSAVFRGLERELEQKLGLESLTLEYNFGKDIRQAMGVTESRAFETQKPDWRVGFVKGFFDRFYLDVKYAQNSLQVGTAATYFNYQLTYKLSPIWSIMYEREPSSLQELNSGYQKTTLKGRVSFW